MKAEIILHHDDTPCNARLDLDLNKTERDLVSLVPF